MLCSTLNRQESCQIYKEALEAADPKALRRLCKEDLFFLILIACKRNDINDEWLYARCREVEQNPDGYLDLWARKHYKSTIITFGKTIQDILNNAEITTGIFSHTRPIAKSFLVQIKRELETNTFLQDLFPEILYKNPQKESPKWSLDNGIIVKRKGNPKESTIEAWGLVDGQPTSKHFKVLLYDDVVTKESVSTPEMIKKTTEALELSFNLGAENHKKRMIGTRYHAYDTYKAIQDKGTAKVRLYAATEDGTATGKPVLLTSKALAEELRDQGSYVFSCQQLQNPLADSVMGFKQDWLMSYDSAKDHSKWNKYIIVDPAGEKKKSDYTAMVVIGLAPDQNYYLLDGIRDRLNLTGRTKKLFELYRKWHPKNSGYEQYGLQSDIEHIKYVQEQENFRFLITPLGGLTPKLDRIRKLVPIFEQHRFYLPHQLLFISSDGKVHDFVSEFKKEEYSTFPVLAHDDMLDAMARITDPDLMTAFPKYESVISKPEFANAGAAYNPLKGANVAQR